MNVNEIIRILSDVRSKYNCFDTKDEECYRGLSEAIKALTAQQWIPCSITPPELGVDGNVLLYGKDGNYAVGWYNGCYRSWDDRFDMDTPVAWMPPPEPWKGEQP